MRKIVGLLDNYDEVERLVDDLALQGFSRDYVHVFGQGKKVPEDLEGMWQGIKRIFGADVPETDTGHHAEGAGRKGVLVVADVPDESAEHAVYIMNQHGAKDVDNRPAE